MLAQPKLPPNNNAEILDQLNSYGQEGRTDLAQVNSVFQLRDVAPSDWAFNALRNLVEKYNCLVGYPDGTYRGGRPLSRYEFAAGLNSCMQQIEKMVLGGDELDPADITQLRSLVQEFEAELATLGARVDDLEGRVDVLEDNQFSTTTKLSGEVVFSITDSWGNTDATDDLDEDTTQVTLGNRVRLTLATSFTGEDTLITRLTAGNASTFAPIGAPGDSNDGQNGMGFQTYEGLEDNNVGIDWLAYYFPVGKATVYVPAVGGLHSDYVSTTFGAKGLEDFTGASGALTFNASSSPIYMIQCGSGLGVNFPASDLIDLSFGYLAPEASDPSQGAGLFDGEYAALAQIAFNLSDKAEVGFTYVNSYHNQNPESSLFNFGGNTGLAGTSDVNDLVDDFDLLESNAFGIQGSYDVTDKVSLAAYGLYMDISEKGETAEDSAEVLSYGLGVAFNDLGKMGNTLGLFVGVPPYLSESDEPDGGDDIPLQIEAFYKYQVTDGISITPGLIFVDNYDQGDSDATNDDSALIGTLRTTFTF